MKAFLRTFIKKGSKGVFGPLNGLAGMETMFVDRVAFGTSTLRLRLLSLRLRILLRTLAPNELIHSRCMRGCQYLLELVHGLAARIGIGLLLLLPLCSLSCRDIAARTYIVI